MIRILIVLITILSFPLSCYAGRNITLPFYETLDSDDYSDLVWLTNGATETFMGSGGWSSGAAKITPPTSTTDGNGGMAALGTFDFSDTSTLYINLLVKFGSEYINTSTAGGGNEQNKFIQITNSTESRHGMLSLMTTSSGDFSIGVCDNSTCKYENGEGTAADDGDWGPDDNSAFLLSEHLDEWICIEYTINVTAGTTAVYIWTQDESLSGLYKEYVVSATFDINQVQGIGGYYNGYHTADADAYVMFDEIRMSSSYIGPPSGFVGAASGAKATTLQQSGGMETQQVTGGIKVN